MGKRPISDFEDPRLKGDVNEADFRSILQVAVLCVANTSIGRPTIAVVFAEMDKAWKNTMAYKVWIIYLQFSFKVLFYNY